MEGASRYPVRYVLIEKDKVVGDAELIGETNKLGAENNNGRKICATTVMPKFGEAEIRDPQWQVPAVLPTGEGGLEVATLTEFTGQDRHKHQKSTEIYTVLRGEFQIYVDDAGPLTLRAGDEIVILPGTVHEVIHRERRARDASESFDLLVRVHAINCHGVDDKYVQLELDGEWRQWSSLSKEDRTRAYREQE